tara:strand:- start:1018 stop:1302 length:285 start_codon:yes stop_codon:yes gene_type:complete
MKFLKFIVISFSILIFLGTAVIIYIVYERFNTKKAFNYDEGYKLNNLNLDSSSEVINVNISDEKLILTIKSNNKYSIIIYDLNTNKRINVIEIN